MVSVACVAMVVPSDIKRLARHGGAGGQGGERIGKAGARAPAKVWDPVMQSGQEGKDHGKALSASGAIICRPAPVQGGDIGVKSSGVGKRAGGFGLGAARPDSRLRGVADLGRL